MNMVVLAGCFCSWDDGNLLRKQFAATTTEIISLVEGSTGRGKLDLLLDLILKKKRVQPRKHAKAVVRELHEETWANNFTCGD